MGTFKGYSATNPRPATDPVGSTESPWRKYASTSVLSNSSTLVGRLLEGTKGAGPEPIGTGGRWAKPTYYGDDSQATHSLKWEAPPWGGSKSSLDGLSFHMPTGCQPAPPRMSEGGDCHFSLVLSEGDCKRYGKPFGTTLQLWHAHWEGSVLKFQTASYGRIDGLLNLGTQTAMSNDMEAGLVRAQELAAANVPHALFAVTHKDRISKSFVSPARHSDGSGGPILMGQRFKLRYTVAELEALAKAAGWPAWRLAVTKAAALFGVIVGDSSGNPFGLQVESRVMYTSVGAHDPFAAFPEWLGLTGGGVDWRRLQAVAPS